MFDAGALIFKLQTIGAQVFKQDQADAKQAIEKTGQAAQTAKGQVDGLGKSSDDAGKKAKSSKAPLTEQAKATEEVGKQSEQASKKQREQAASTEQQISAARQLSAALLIAGTAAAAMVGLAVAKHTEFDAAMSNVRAATMATAQEQRALGDAALDAGADTAYSASEAAAAQEELAKAGQSVAQIVGGSLNGALALAAAGQLQVARSAEIMATTLTQFRLPAEKAAHVSDVLAAGAGKAQGSVDDLALALSYVGPLAGSVGFSLNETAGAIAYFATQGIIGEKAGTSLRGVLASLQAPSALADKEMQKYNISMFDANGNMLSLSGIAEQLRTRLGGLTEQERLAALGRIFGNESLNAATLLYEGGAEKVDEWTAAVDDSGFAAEQARIRQDNLRGDVEKLGGAFDTALIKSGSAANNVLRGMVQVVTELVDMYGEAPEPVQATATAIGIAAAAILLGSGAAVGARAKFLELKLALDQTSTSMGKTALIGGAVGLALTGIITVVGLLMAKQAEARQKAEAYADTLEEGTNRVTKATRDMVKENLAAADSFLWLENKSAYDNAESLGLSLDMVTDAAMGNVDALKELKEIQEELNALDRSAETGAYNTAAHERAEAINAVVAASIGESESIEESIRVAEQKQRADEDSADTAQTAAEAYIAEADSVEELTSQLSTLIDTINEANGVGQDAVTANADYQESLIKAAEQVENIRNGVEGFGAGLSLSTQAGIDNTNMLVQLAQDSQDAAAKQLELDGNTQAYTASLIDGRQRLIDTAIAMGATSEEAQVLADKVYAIPSQKEIDIIAETETAETRLQRLHDKLMSIPGYRKVTLETIVIGNKTVSASDFADGAVVSYNAAGNIYRGSENHVAQIARGGSIRVWNEPETAGETYVPHALSKRARSEQIMIETARIFGGTYIPAGAAMFANGSPAPSPQPVTVSGPSELVVVDADGVLIGRMRVEASSVVSERSRSGAGPAVRSRFAGR